MKQTLTEKVKEAIYQEYVLKTHTASEPIPTEQNLAKKYSVSLVTVRRAIENLVNEKYLVKRQGKGTFLVQKQNTEGAFSIGLVVPETSNSPFYTILSTLLEPLLRKDGHDVRFFVAQDAKKLKDIIDGGSFKLDGLILCGYILNHQVLREAQIPYVVAGSEDRWDANCVSFDLRAGAIEITNSLLKAGHEKILFLSNYEEKDLLASSIRGHFSLESSARYSGYISALHYAGLTPSPELIVHTGGTKRNAYMLMDSILKKNELDFSAIFASTDIIAEGVIQAVWKNGYKIPDDFSIIGCDNLYSQNDHLVPFSTLDLKLNKVASRAIDLLYKLISDYDNDEYCCYSIIPKLINRGTVRKIKKQKKECFSEA